MGAKAGMDADRRRFPRLRTLLARPGATWLAGALLCAVGCATGNIPREPPRTAGVDLIAVPDVLQSTDFSCGAAALQSVLAYYGVGRSEAELIELLGTNEETGTTPESMARVAGELGLRASIGENLALNELRVALEEGVPVIVAFQAWAEDKPPGFSWPECWDEGHYAVVIGMDEDYVYLEDPSLFGSRGRIAVGEFLERWHDDAYSGESPADIRDRRWIRLGIFVRERAGRGRRPPAFTDVE